ncbi:MAG: beta-galactosidase [Candidatus Schekmanbacteria bacterium]|nr:beta-galactosidase [Candidatus Schekmanbacteria bacterium]
MLARRLTVSLGIVLVSWGAHARAESGASWSEQHENKAGLYLRLPQQQRGQDAEYFMRHPLIDAAIVSMKWSELEPEAGKYNFSEMDRLLAIAKKLNKGIVFAFSTYGQSPTDQPTPAWLYDNGVRRITFSGGGASKKAKISVPMVWDNKYLDEYEKFIKKISDRYSGETRIWYIMPGIGHIGNVKPQPSKGGAMALKKAGWNPRLWEEFSLKVVDMYQTNFHNTPLLVKAGLWYLRDPKHDNYSREADSLLTKLAEKRVSIITFGLEPDARALDKNKVVKRLADLAPRSVVGEIRVGIGDDWPLWVPGPRRVAKPTRGRDDLGLSKELEYAFGGVEGLPKTNISILYVLHPEVDASHPEKGDKQNKEVYRLLEAARKRLKEEDPVRRRARGPGEATGCEQAVGSGGVDLSPPRPLS